MESGAEGDGLRWMASDQPNLLHDLALAPEHPTKCWNQDALSVHFGLKPVNGVGWGWEAVLGLRCRQIGRDTGVSPQFTSSRPMSERREER